MDYDQVEAEPQSGRVGWVALGLYVGALALFGLASVDGLDFFALPALLLLGISLLATAAWALREPAHGCLRLFILLMVVGMQLILAVPVVLWAMLQNADFGPKGRLLRIGGRARVARTAVGTAWRADEEVPLADALSVVERAVGAEAWHLAAQAEHASVPAFARLSLQLVALGAPPELVEGAHRAAIDEVDHARRCFAISEAWGGIPWDPGTLPELADALADRRPPDLVRLARGSLRDGCLGEGVSAMLAGRLSERAEVPGVGAVLARIAEDEHRHAALAWQVVAWCRARGGAAVDAALRVEAASLEGYRASSVPELVPLSVARLHALGLPDRALAEACVVEGIALVRARLHAEGLSIA